MRTYITELIGTFFLVTAIAFTGNPAAIGLTLAAAVYFGGHISGAHYNPAVTLALFIRKKINVNEATFYVMSQLIGAILAVYFADWYGKKFIVTVAIGVTPLQAILAEATGTFLLASVVLAVAATEKTKGNHIYGFAIGLTVTAMAFAFGSVTGGAFNPSVFIASMLRASDFSEVWIYLLGTLGGGALAGFLHKYLTEEVS
ncbi:MAG: hypothetical protein A3H98_02730 [Bacteroidetes bacterium RIFCSPLOWO2_02_FULL_36_8]|nr:MAG: hypothetical protein A3H98_02730 [Bacteroidetes bacterium RIFCSPLOWO2_02_FULL_36_8]OFY72198.1 MAG: hypothetical protein A3G23_01350 [Bacteroidetes bacterium RIFCSPLOWO2_12_FULL_37_12]